MKQLIFPLTLLIIIHGCKSQTIDRNESPNDNLDDRFSESLTDFKNKNKVKGLAFALFNRDSVIWQQSLGKSTYGHPIDNRTLFSIQSMSKNMTALAVMMAVQDGLLNLDTPISTYLPDFTVNSCFEDHPEDKINLTMLLSHTAGFTHEAPVGGNYDFTNCSFDEHINSIPDTWLMFPPGTGYSYSNLGMDLATQILEEVSGEKFEIWLKQKIFSPLNMPLTTINDIEFRENNNKTEGMMGAVKVRHYCIPLIGSGAVYANLSGMIRYVQFHLNNGEIGNKRLIEQKYLDTMYSIISNQYGLGTVVGKTDGIWFINHNGGGYGYSSTMLWYPEYGLGAVLLCNRPVGTFDICEQFMKSCVHLHNLKKNDRFTRHLDSLNGKYFTNADTHKPIPRKHCSTDTLYRDEWENYTGTYRYQFKGLQPKWYVRLAVFFGYYPFTLKIIRKDNVLFAESTMESSILRQYRKGFFFTNSGEVIDFTSSPPTYGNIELQKR